MRRKNRNRNAPNADVDFPLRVFVREIVEKGSDFELIPSGWYVRILGDAIVGGGRFPGRVEAVQAVGVLNPLRVRVFRNGERHGEEAGAGRDVDPGRFRNMLVDEVARLG